ncbi:hypothetical protein Q4R55_19175, partial [Morganella morganii subsp. sibonii]
MVDEADEGRRRHRPGEQETLHRVATRLPQPRKAVGCFGTVAKLAMRQPFVLFKGLTFQKLC